MEKFNGVKVFSATKWQDREVLGEKVTEWIRARPSLRIIDTVVTQSSDAEFHCITITLIYDEPIKMTSSPPAKRAS